MTAAQNTTQSPKLSLNSEKIRLLIAVVVPLVAFAFGVLVMLSRYAYAEDGHNTLLMVYIGACAVLVFALKRMSFVLLALTIFVMLVVQVYAAKKFDWRQEYILNAQSGKPFPLEEMIVTYPTYEEHLFSFLGAPDWVRFNRDCVQPALNGEYIMDACRSPQTISEKYRIDILYAMGELKNKMQNTAKRVEAGKLSRRSEYLACIANKACATIPLLPKGVDAEKLDPMSRDYIEIRQAFWSLVKDKKMSSGTCQLTPICKSLVKLGIVNPDSMPF